MSVNAQKPAADNNWLLRCKVNLIELSGMKTFDFSIGASCMPEQPKIGNFGRVVGIVCALILAGCAQPQSVIVRQSGQCRNQIRVPNLGTSEAMVLAEKVLGQMHFTIEKADIESGLMRTRPLSGAQFFEFWRSDNVGPDNSLQANLHTIRRTVELEISRQGKELCIACSVRVQRLSIPERQVSSTARAYEMFSRSSSTLQRLALNPEQRKNMAWIDLDKDVLLAEEILRRIEAKIAGRASNERHSTENET